MAKVLEEELQPPSPAFSRRSSQRRAAGRPSSSYIPAPNERDDPFVPPEADITLQDSTLVDATTPNSPSFHIEDMSESSAQGLARTLQPLSPTRDASFAAGDLATPRRRTNLRLGSSDRPNSSYVPATPNLDSSSLQEPPRSAGYTQQGFDQPLQPPSPGFRRFDAQTNGRPSSMA